MCRYFAGLLLGCLKGASKEELLSPRYSPVPNHYEENPLVSIAFSVGNRENTNLYMNVHVQTSTMIQH